MTERIRSADFSNWSANRSSNSTPMAEDLSPRKSLFAIVIVVVCFAVLWPKVFYPMLVGSTSQHTKPIPIHRSSGCCDVISETDVNTIKIMSELCSSIIQQSEEKPLTGSEIVSKCQAAVLDTCGIDISALLQEQVRLGQSVKQILDEVRSLNGSLCLKYNFGVAPWRLGVPHRITVKMSSASDIRQERPLHLRAELVHPAFRERGSAIPHRQEPPPSRPPPRVVEGRPGPLPGMRPTIGSGHVVPQSKQGSSMSVFMPMYTVGVVIFFVYTLIKFFSKKQQENGLPPLYQPVEPDRNFRREVFESEKAQLGSRMTKDGASSKLVVNAVSALLDEVDHELEARRKANRATQDDQSGTINLSNGTAVKPHENDEQPTVKVMGMEMTASCEGGKKWSRPDSPVLRNAAPPVPEPLPPPQEIFLEGALPAQSQLLVADSATEAQLNSAEDPAVVLAGKMTLSVISLDSSENGTEESSNSDKRREEMEIVEKGSSNGSESFEKIEADLQLEEQINDIIKEAENITSSALKDIIDIDLLEEIQQEVKEDSIVEVIDSDITETDNLLDISENHNIIDNGDFIQQEFEELEKQVEPLKNIAETLSDDENIDIFSNETESIPKQNETEQESKNIESVLDDLLVDTTNSQTENGNQRLKEEQVEKIEPGILLHENRSKTDDVDDRSTDDLDDMVDNEVIEEAEDDGELEEVVYEESESEEEDEIRNLDRKSESEDRESLGKVNGLEDTYRTTTSSATAAERDISEDANSGSEEEEIEEVIEYVDEEEEEDGNENEERSTANHVADGPQQE